MLSLLYIISRPYFRSIRRHLNVDNIFWEDGRCPVCNSVPTMSVIEKNEFRKYRCSFCGTLGHYKRIGCPYCQSEKADRMDIIYSENDDRVRVDACMECRSYCKTAEASMLTVFDMEEIDLISLPLDIVAQDKGFVRRSPNPVGITSTRQKGHAHNEQG
jgi:FdhE protein